LSSFWFFLPTALKYLGFIGSCALTEHLVDTFGVSEENVEAWDEYCLIFCGLSRNVAS